MADAEIPGPQGTPAATADSARTRLQVLSTRILGAFGQRSGLLPSRSRLLVFCLIAVSLGAALWKSGPSQPVGPALAAGGPSVGSLTDGVLDPASELFIGSLPPFPGRRLPVSSVRRRSNLRTIVPSRPRLAILKVTVEAGDTLFGIAERFGLKPETLLWGNFEALQENPSGLRPGQELNVLPVDGTYYTWNEGDNLEAVAAFFGVDPEAILDWPGNNLVHDAAASVPVIEPGTSLVVPGGKRALVTWQAPRISRSNPAAARYAGPGACGSVYDGPIGEGFFLWPTTGRTLSGYGYSSLHPGIDIAGSTGNAIYASASGVVVYAGWNDYGYGYMVVIDHGDGWQTLYAHMSRVGVACGQPIFQGNVIGGVGSTGNSSGPHLHFETEHDSFGKVNPYDLVSP